MNAVVSFEDSVKERLKSIVADLIPEERWDGLVRLTVAEFERTDLPKLVRAELAEQYRKAIALEFAKPEWQAKWSQEGSQCVSAAVSKMIVDSAPLVLASMIGGSVQNVVSHLQSAMASGRNY